MESSFPLRAAEEFFTVCLESKGKFLRHRSGLGMTTITLLVVPQFFSGFRLVGTPTQNSQWQNSLKKNERSNTSSGIGGDPVLTK
jgi:hypothetical protein